MARSKALDKVAAKDFAESICDDLASSCEGEGDDMLASWRLIRAAVDEQLGLQSKPLRATKRRSVAARLKHEAGKLRAQVEIVTTTLDQLADTLDERSAGPRNYHLGYNK